MQTENNNYPTPITDAAIEADSYLYQILYPSRKDRPVRSSRMADLERQLSEAKEELAHLKAHTVHIERFFESQRLLREACEQRDKLFKVINEIQSANIGEYGECSNTTISSLTYNALHGG